jgi:hypothetical protein
MSHLVVGVRSDLEVIIEKAGAEEYAANVKSADAAAKSDALTSPHPDNAKSHSVLRVASLRT